MEQQATGVNVFEDGVEPVVQARIEGTALNTREEGRRTDRDHLDVPTVFVQPVEQLILLLTDKFGHVSEQQGAARLCRERQMTRQVAGVQGERKTGSQPINHFFCAAVRPDDEHIRMSCPYDLHDLALARDHEALLSGATDARSLTTRMPRTREFSQSIADMCYPTHFHAAVPATAGDNRREGRQDFATGRD
jgi:hypothetical protein